MLCDTPIVGSDEPVRQPNTGRFQEETGLGPNQIAGAYFPASDVLTVTVEDSNKNLDHDVAPFTVGSEYNPDCEG